MTAIPQKTCESCKDPSRQISGFWDGHDKNTGKRTSGAVITCSNTSCPDYRSPDDYDHIYDSVKLENKKAQIDISALQMLIRQKGLLIGEAADIVHIGPAELSAYLHERRPFPRERFQRLFDELSKLPNDPSRQNRKKA